MASEFIPYNFGPRVQDNTLLRQQTLDYLIKEQRHHELMQFIYGTLFVLAIVLLFYGFKHRKKLFNIICNVCNKMITLYKSYTITEKLLATVVVCLIVLIILSITFISYFYG